MRPNDPSRGEGTVKGEYRGHEIEVTRERCMGGWDLLYYSIFRAADGYECTSGFSYDESPVRTFFGYMEQRVDDELATDDPWQEKADAA
jgi:hypothetical protein